MTTIDIAEKKNINIPIYKCNIGSNIQRGRYNNIYEYFDKCIQFLFESSFKMFVFINNNYTNRNETPILQWQKHFTKLKTSFNKRVQLSNYMTDISYE